ncbi:hypothetical protein D6855_15805 [Butyrivibrio sp. CB08]|uniref:hypothetical protein n=1 Tax=Butyrivibrio sp. CB08 TaxID=2364879 RepID=UPI000EA9FB06|nr:hypothetical protein [Butyrivibrio sp. CB08]RKM55400.1 hypothetical protein D6855_15805 [Butyrivibrio sp. CB08]
MRNKTKWLAVVLCLCLFASMAIGSGSSSSDDKKEITGTDQSADSDAKSDTKTEDSSDSSAKAEEAKAEEITVEEQVLVDEAGIKVTATGYETDSIWGDGIKLLLENESDKTVTVGCNALIVNDFMISDLFVSEVAPGKKANETMHLSSSELKAAGIDSVGQVEIYFHIYNSDDWTDVVNPDVVTIKTSAYDHMDTSADDSGFELYNEDGIRIVGKTVDENSFWGTAILLYIENNSGKNVGINVDDMSINGFMMTPYFSTTVYDGKKAFDDITIMSSELEENSISAIEEVELKFHIYNADTYDTIKDTDPITFTAQ